MVTKTITPALESTSDNNVSEYAGYDFGQVNLDIIQFEQSMFETYLKHDFGTLQALDESSLQVINEMTFKEAVDKLVEFISSIWDKISQAFTRAITTLSAKLNLYGKFAKKMEEKVNSQDWVDSSEKVESIAITFYDKIDDFTLISAVEHADKFVTSIMKYIDTRDESVLMDFSDKKEYFKKTGTKNTKGVNSATLKDLSGQDLFDRNTFNLTCDKQNAMFIINSLKNAKHTVASLTQTKKTAEKAFKTLKSKVSVLKAMQGVEKNKDEDALKVVATAQKAISTYSSIVNMEINASISALGKMYSSGIKVLNQMSSKCMKKVQKANKFNSEELPPEEKPLSSEGAEDGDYKEVKESVFDDFDMFGMILEGEFGDNGEFIEPGDPDVDETEPQIDPEKDNYGNDPEDDDARPDLMNDSDGVETVTSESLYDDDFNPDSMILGEGEFGDNGEFIEPGDPDVDETEIHYDPEKDNYGNDPEDDDARPDLMNDSDGVETVTSESFFDDVDFDMMMLEGEFIEPGDPDVDETEPQIDPEKDNYGNDPEDDDARPDLMNDSDGVETVTSESDIDSFFNDDDIL